MERTWSAKLAVADQAHMLSLNFARSPLLAQLGAPLALASCVTALRTTL